MQTKGVSLEDVKQLNEVRDKLKEVYAMIPETKGCMDNIHKEGGCGAWCCQTQNPQVLYTEFVNAWRHVNQEWDSESVIQLIASAVRNYLNNTITKGCIFWDKNSKLCSLHEYRPMNCRIYGITPDEEFKPRYERLKVLYPNDEVRNQCNLIKTIDEKPITKEDTDRYWHALVEVEKSYGVPSKQINDAPGGTYRTFHDHVMMSLYNQNIMIELSKMRVNATQEVKEKFIYTVVSLLRKQQADDAAERARKTAFTQAVNEAKPTFEIKEGESQGGSGSQEGNEDNRGNGTGESNQSGA